MGLFDLLFGPRGTIVTTVTEEDIEARIRAAEDDAVLTPVEPIGSVPFFADSGAGTPPPVVDHFGIIRRDGERYIDLRAVANLQATVQYNLQQAEAMLAEPYRPPVVSDEEWQRLSDDLERDLLALPPYPRDPRTGRPVRP